MSKRKWSWETAATAKLLIPIRIIFSIISVNKVFPVNPEKDIPSANKIFLVIYFK